jgi:hypothetical protein
MTVCRAGLPELLGVLVPGERVPSVIAPERLEEFAPGLDASLLALIQATAEQELADIENLYGPTGATAADALKKK